MDLLINDAVADGETSEDNEPAGSSSEDEIDVETDEDKGIPVVVVDGGPVPLPVEEEQLEEVVLTDEAQMDVEKVGAELTLVMSDFEGHHANQFMGFGFGMDGITNASPRCATVSPRSGRRLSRSKSLDRGLVDDFELLAAQVQELPSISGEDVNLTFQNLSSSFLAYRSSPRNSFLPPSRSPSPSKRSRARSEGESSDYSSEFREKWATVEEFLSSVGATKSAIEHEMPEEDGTQIQEGDSTIRNESLLTVETITKSKKTKESPDEDAPELTSIEEEEEMPSRVHAVSLGQHGKLYASMVCFVEDREKNRKINDYQVDKLIKTFTTMPVRAMATAFIAVPAYASPGEISGFERFKEWDEDVVKQMIAEEVPGFLRVKGGNHRMRAFAILQETNVLPKDVEIEAKVYLGLDEDEAMWLAAEDNLVTGCTLPPQFVDFIELLRTLMIEVISKRKDELGNPVVVDPEFPIPKLQQSESSYVKKKLLKQTDITDFEYAQKVSRYLDLARYPERNAETVVQFLTQLESPAKDKIQNLKGKVTFICEDKQRLVLSPSHISKILTVQVDKKNYPRPWSGQTGIIAMMLEACGSCTFSGFRTHGLSVPDVSADDPARRRSSRRSASLTNAPTPETFDKSPKSKKRKSKSKGGEAKRGKATEEHIQGAETIAVVTPPVTTVEVPKKNSRVSLRLGGQVLSLPLPTRSELRASAGTPTTSKGTAPPPARLASTLAPAASSGPAAVGTKTSGRLPLAKKGVDGKTLFFGPSVDADASSQQPPGQLNSSDVPEDLSKKVVGEERTDDERSGSASPSPSPSSRRKQAAPKKAREDEGASGELQEVQAVKDTGLLGRLRDRVRNGQFTVEVSQGDKAVEVQEEVSDAESAEDQLMDEEEVQHEVITQCPEEFIIKASDAFLMFRNLAREFTFSVIRLGLQRLTFLAPMYCKTDGVPTVHRTDFVRYRLYRTPDFSPKVVEVDEDEDDAEEKKAKKKNKKKVPGEQKNTLIKVIDFGWLLKSKTSYSPKEANTDKEVQIVIPKTGKKTDKLKTAMSPATVVLDGRLFIPIESNHVSYYSNTVSFGSAKFVHAVIDRLYPEIFRDMLWKGQLNNPTDEVPHIDEFIEMAHLFPNLQAPTVKKDDSGVPEEAAEESGDSQKSD